MAHKLSELLATERRAIVDFIVAGLREQGLPHYEHMDREVLSARVEPLVAAFLEAIAGDRHLFAEFVQRLAERRLAEGYYLHELQAVFTLLDERACEIAAAHGEAAVADRNLLKISRTIGQARDELARMYLAKIREAEAMVSSLERRIEELDRGGAPDKRQLARRGR